MYLPTLLSSFDVFSMEDLIWRAPPFQDRPELVTLARNAKHYYANGDRVLDFPRPLPYGAKFLGDLSRTKEKIATAPMEDEWTRIAERTNSNGTIVFSPGTLVNTSTMPERMMVSDGGGGGSLLVEHHLEQWLGVCPFAGNLD